MAGTDETQSIVEAVQVLEQASNEADPPKAESVLWLDDDRFSEIEDFVPEPFGADGVRGIHEWIRENGVPGDHVRFTHKEVHLLSLDVAYGTCIQELTFDEPSTSRVTFVFLKQGDKWGVIRAHYSTTPQGE